MADQFKPYPDGGSLHATQSKRSPKSADYWGEIALNLKDMTNIRVEDGLTIVKINGWKKVSKSNGKTYLSLSVNRYVPEEEGGSKRQAPARQEDDNDDVPF